MTTRVRLYIARRRVGIWNEVGKTVERRLRRAYDRLVELEHRL